MRTHDNRNDLSRSTIFFFKVLAVIFGGVRIVVPGEPGRGWKPRHNMNKYNIVLSTRHLAKTALCRHLLPVFRPLPTQGGELVGGFYR